MKILIAGIGNIFHGDDGFGPAMATAARVRTWPVDVVVTDFGIRGMDLALALTTGLDAAILVDTMARGGAPGTLYVVEPTPAAEQPVTLDSHVLDPARVLAFATALGPLPPIVRVVGCEPATAQLDDDMHMGLSDAVAAAVVPAVDLVAELVATLRADHRAHEAACTS